MIDQAAAMDAHVTFLDGVVVGRNNTPVHGSLPQGLMYARIRLV
jgi:hypothetical protein